MACVPFKDAKTLKGIGLIKKANFSKKLVHFFNFRYNVLAKLHP